MSSNAIACSFAPGFILFSVDPNNFESKMENDKIALLPMPEVQIDNITRGSAAPGASCDDAGILELTISWPEDSTYKLNDIGFYFQISSGSDPNYIFPLEPIVGTIKKNQSKFTFIWLDGDPKNQKEINLNLNIFAVNKGLQVGQPTVVKIKANKG